MFPCYTFINIHTVKIIFILNGLSHIFTCYYNVYSIIVCYKINISLFYKLDNSLSNQSNMKICRM